MNLARWDIPVPDSGSTPFDCQRHSCFALAQHLLCPVYSGRIDVALNGNRCQRRGIEHGLAMLVACPVWYLRIGNENSKHAVCSGADRDRHACMQSMLESQVGKAAPESACFDIPGGHFARA